MDKSGSVGNVAKNIVAAPDHPPVREVEYGCGKYSNKVDAETCKLTDYLEHLGEFMDQGPSAWESLRNAYISVQNTLSKPLETQVTKDPKDPKKIPMTTLRPTFICLQCSTISSIDDRDHHSSKTRHMLCE